MKCNTIKSKNSKIYSDNTGLHGTIKKSHRIRIVLKDNENNVIDDTNYFDPSIDTSSTYIDWSSGSWIADTQQLLIDEPSLICNKIRVCVYTCNISLQCVLTESDIQIIPTELFELSSSYSITADEITISMNWYDKLSVYNAPEGTFEILLSIYDKSTNETVSVQKVLLDGNEWNTPTISESLYGDYNVIKYTDYLSGIIGDDSIFDRDEWTSEEINSNMDCCIDECHHLCVHMDLLVCSRHVEHFTFELMPTYTVLYPEIIINDDDTGEYIYISTGNPITTDVDGGAFLISIDSNILSTIPALQAPDITDTYSYIPTNGENISLMFITSTISEIEGSYTLSVHKNLPILLEEEYNILLHNISITNPINKLSDISINIAPLIPTNYIDEEYVVLVYINNKVYAIVDIPSNLTENITISDYEMNVGQHTIHVQLINKTTGQRYNSYYQSVSLCYQ